MIQLDAWDLHRATRRLGRNQYTPFAETRGMQAFDMACAACQIHPDDVPALRGKQSARFHTLWSAFMRDLARAAGAWKAEWDDPTYAPARWTDASGRRAA